MCTGLNPEQLGQVVGREVGLEEKGKGNPGNCFEPSPLSPHSLFCTKEQLLGAAFLFILPDTFALLQGPMQP